MPANAAPTPSTANTAATMPAMAPGASLEPKLDGAAGSVRLMSLPQSWKRCAV